jgi:hypothetical protein
MQISRPPIVGVPAFFWCAFRAIVAHVLADLELAQFFDHVRADDQGDQQRRQARKRRAEGKVPENSERAEVGEQFLVQQPVEQTSSGRIADLLYLTRSAVATIATNPRVPYTPTADPDSGST